MKRNGFVFIETVIVLVVLLVGVLSLYGTYASLSTNLSIRSNYDNISDLYKADIALNSMKEELSTDLEEYIIIDTDVNSRNYCTRNMEEGCAELLNELNIDKIYINLIPINEILEGSETVTNNVSVDYTEPLNNSLIEYLKTLKIKKSDGTYDYKKLFIVQFKNNEKTARYASLEYKLPDVNVTNSLGGD